MAKVSIILRARNEERWIGKTLRAIQEQDYPDHETILVDNGSTDNTREIFHSMMPEGRLVEIERFKPGQAINDGIRASDGEFVVVLSAHCIPENARWLSSYMDVMQDERIGAAYGRQLPFPTSDPLDRRDLLNTFGIERRIQFKDTFFHNANSMIRRELWERFPFDEETPHIEDRLWAEQIIATGVAIAYEPEAAVYHHHGINHHQNKKRARAISDILTHRTMVNGHEVPALFSETESQTLFCFLGHEERTHESLKRLLDDAGLRPDSVYVHSNAPDLARELGVHAIERVDGDDERTFVEIIGQLMTVAAGNGLYPDCVVYANLRLRDLGAAGVREVVATYFAEMYDSVFFADSEYANVWRHSSDGEYRQMEANYQARSKKDPVYLARYGLGVATRPEFVRTGNLVGSKVGIIRLDSMDQ